MEEVDDQTALALVQERDGELTKIAKCPEKIYALLGREFGADESLWRFKQQVAGLEPI